MKRSYDSAATANVIGEPYAERIASRRMSCTRDRTRCDRGRDHVLRRRPRRPRRHDRAGEGVRARPPRLRDPERGRHPFRDRERDEGPDSAGGREPDRGAAGSSSSTTARSVLGNDLPLIDDAVTVEQLLGAPLGHRRLPRRGGRARAHRLPDAGAGARARDDRAVPRRARRPPDQVRARRALLATATAATSCSR